MSYPKSKKSAKRYADYLSELHGKKFLPIERKDKKKEKFKLSINFAAAAEGEEVEEFVANGWKLVD